MIPSIPSMLGRLMLATVLLFTGALHSWADDGSVNINAADAHSIADALVGVGMVRAEAIVAFREDNGRFADPYELVQVKGVSEATVMRNEERIRLQD
jgi:competence ComEA-like helix-hairpin-helix protein